MPYNSMMSDTVSCFTRLRKKPSSLPLRIVQISSDACVGNVACGPAPRVISRERRHSYSLGGAAASSRS
eukprot:scaffold14916_cov128-Isochrysis_galbana.AAC.10